MDRKRLKRIWQEYKKRRVLKAFYAMERKSPKSEKIFRYFLIFFSSLYFVFRKAATFNSVLTILAIIILALISAFIITERMEKKNLEQKCRKNLASSEFRKRLDKAGWEDILKAISEKVSEKYQVQDLKIEENRLQGFYKGQAIALYYCAMEEDERVETREIISIIKKCRRDGINDIRVFTNNEFSNKAQKLGERFDLNLVLYDGKSLKELLRETGYIPSEAEIDSLIIHESEKRIKRIALIKEQALKGEKYVTYFIYGTLLMVMAWLEIGIMYLNLIFGSILYGLFVYTLYKKISEKEEKLLF